MHTIKLPYVIELKNKKFYINLNQYRNAHFHILNSAKVAFKEQILSQINKLPKFNVIKLTYRVYPPSRRMVDINNICSVADKFFCDALVEAKKLEDDNYSFLVQTTFSFGEVDKLNARIEVDIEETKPMKITLEKKEIKAALLMYLNRMMSLPTETTELELVATVDGEFIAQMDVSLGQVSGTHKPTLRSVTGSVDSTGGDVVTAAKEEPRKAEPEKEEKPSLLNTQPKAAPRKIDFSKKSEKNPTENTTVDSVEPTSDVPAQNNSNSESQLKAGTINGDNEEPKPKTKSIFNFSGK